MAKQRDEKLVWIEGLRGPAQWKESDARRVLEALAASGDTLAGFARRHGLTSQRISWWRSRLGDWLPDASTPAPSLRKQFESGFVPVIASRVEIGSNRVVAVVRVGNVAIDVCDPSAATASWLASFIEALGARA